jgi:hypothetical protein
MKRESWLSEQRELYTALKQGPAFLFLGQDYLRLESGTDSFLSEIVRKYGKGNASPVDYNQIFESTAQKSIDSSLAWMHQLCERLSVPEWLATVADFPWNGVYTSAIDTIWLRCFESEWRELHPLFDEKYNPIDPRNRSRLHCTFLFGRVDQADEATRPPLTIFESSTREQVAVSLARRLPELITPWGVLIIEGYVGDTDWFNPKLLSPIINQLNPGQTHIFSATPSFLQNAYISHLVNNDKLILHDESLATFLLKGETAGFIKLGRRVEEEEHGRRIQLGDEILTVPSQTWQQVSRSAMILDDAVLIPPRSLSEDGRYQEFRHFLAQSSARPQWSGYQRGFAFSREFEKELRKQVDMRLKSNQLQRDAVILHGQTGTGKTVALGALAYQIRKERKYPVLFIERKSQKPVNSEIETFCEWAEDCGATSTLVIWDGMVEIEQYYNLLQYLTGRGRKVVLVGSCYRIEKNKQSPNLIEASANFSENEIHQWTTFLTHFDPSLGALIEKQVKEYDCTFLVALYRLLPPTRSQIRSGVVREVGLAEQEIKRKAQEGKLKPVFENTLGRALLEAGIPQEILFSSEKGIGGEKVEVLQNLTALVMVPGRFGLNVPIELLLRAIGREDYLNFVEVLSGIDIIQWYEDELGNIEVGPRHPLEAKLIVQSRLGGPQTEVDFVRQLLVEVKDSDRSIHTREEEFAVNLVHNMGPKSQDKNYFLSHYQGLSQALQELREQRGVQNPQLMLKEANLLRELVAERSKSGTPLDDAQELLNKAEEVLGYALKIVENQGGRSDLQSSIRVELASTLGAKIKHALDMKHSAEAIRLFQEAHVQLFKARALNPESYYPIDVLAWTTKDILNSKVIEPPIRAEAEADILEVFATAEIEDFSADQRELFHQRRMEIGHLVGKNDLSEEAFQALLNQGSKAGYCLKALRIVGEWPTDAELSDAQRKRCCDGANYLEEHREAIEDDGRCLNLLLHLWWMAKTGRRIFHGERQTVPFSRDDWQYCWGVISKLLASSELYKTPRIKYLYGLAAFHLDDIENAVQIFREIAQDTGQQGHRRIVSSYLVSQSDGQPKVFTGTVKWTNGKDKGGVYIPKFRRNIPFNPMRFNRPDIQSGESLGEFHIAFNFIGPIADPIRNRK